jgi:hypothetical protein
MTQQTAPFIEGKYGWALGESNWNLGMDENLVKFSYLFDRNLDGIVSTLPVIVNGQAYFNTTDNRVYYATGGVFYSSPTPKWFEFVLRATGEVYQFNGTSLNLGNTDTAYTDALRTDLASSNTSKGVTGVFGAPRVVNSIAELRLLPKTGTGNVFVTTPGQGGYFKLDLADITSTDNDITTYVTTDGGRFKRIWDGSVNVMWAGAKCDGVTDDTAKVQIAINYCATFADWPSLEIPGTCKLTSSLIIDRLVDTTTSEFIIHGSGKKGGFHATTNITFFDSSLAMAADPQSEFVTFKDINFTCDILATGPKVISPKFLRMKFINCYFKFVKLMTNVSTYVQSLYFTNCNIRTWPGVFLFATHGFDIDFNGCISEFGSGYLVDFANGCYSVRFRGGVHEGSVGGLISTGNVWQLYVAGYYFEANDQPSLQFNAGASNRSISVIGCFFGSSVANVANASFYEIDWGNTSAGISLGNTQQNGRLHDNDSIPAGTSAPRFFSEGDSAAITLFKSPLIADQASGTFALSNSLATGTLNFARYRRNGNSINIEFSYTFSGTSGSSVIMTGLPIAAISTVFGGTVTFTDLAGEMYLIGGPSAPNSTTSTSFAICSTKQGTPITYTTLNGKTVVGHLEIAI